MPTPTHALITQLFHQYKLNGLPSIIDYGCGSGDLLVELPTSSLSSYLGCDVNPHSLRALKKRFSSKKIRTLWIDKNKKMHLPSDQKYDAVISVGVLQYMTNQQIQELLMESHRVLKKGGILIISCTHDSWLYKLWNIYGLVLPHRYFSQAFISKQLRKYNFSVKFLKAKGIFFNPLFSYFIVFFFDALDKIFFKTKGTLGPVGKWTRNIIKPLLQWEITLPINSGYTIFAVAQK